MRPLSELIGRVRGYGGARLREAGGAVAPRRWMPGGRSSETLLDEEFLRRLERLSVFSSRSVKAVWRVATGKPFTWFERFLYGGLRQYVLGRKISRVATSEQPRPAPVVTRTAPVVGPARLRVPGAATRSQRAPAAAVEPTDAASEAVGAG